MELSERQQRNLVLLSCVFVGATGLIANDLLSGGEVDRAWILFAVGCLAASIEMLFRARGNRPGIWPSEGYQRAVITLLLIGFVEVAASLVIRSTTNVASETAKIVVFSGAIAVGLPAILIPLLRGRNQATEPGPVVVSEQERRETEASERSDDA
ncbi:MAG TPA: hypothetical protein VHV31_05675 [Nitrolancea sp.]|jgi:hypothetical protein|nr:hypothetical protein [Nitrolancea sp.]